MRGLLRALVALLVEKGYPKCCEVLACILNPTVTPSKKSVSGHCQKSLEDTPATVDSQLSMVLWEEG